MNVFKMPLVLILAALTLAFSVLAMVLSVPILIQVLNYMLVVTAVAVTVSYWPGVMYALKQRQPERIGLMTLGIVMSWVAVALGRSWTGLVRVLDDPAMTRAPIVAVYLMIAIVAGALHLAAPGASSGVPRRNWIVISVTAGIGAGLALLALSLGLGER
jgi:hypothetical protein